MNKGEDVGFTISDLVEEFCISHRAIRYYEEIGLIKPKRSSGNHRLYSRRDRARIKMILRAKLLGFSMSEIAELLHLYDIDPTQKKQYEEGIALAQKHLREVQNRIHELQRLESDLKHAIEVAEAQLQSMLKGKSKDL